MQPFDTRRVASVGFFDDPGTIDAISRLGAADKLTIFVGAGVSADQRVPAWADLVRILLGDLLPADLRSRSVSRGGSGAGADLPGAIVDAYFQLPMASAVDQVFEMREPGNGVFRRNEAIALLLYQQGDSPRSFLQRPSLAVDALMTAIILKACGKDVHVLSTNYDSVLEEIAAHDPEIVNLLDEYGLDVRPYAASAPGKQAPDCELPIVHIHGYLPRTGPALGVVFSEPDYVEWAENSVLRRYMYSRFDHGHLVMVGASLRDHNVISYLRQTDINTTNRYALLPLQGDPGFEIGKQVGFQLLTAVQERRGEQLGINVLTPDFFGQVRQFLIEVRLAAVLPANLSYNNSAYGTRLRLWQEDFKRRCYEVADNELRATDLLVRLATVICLQVPEATHVKAELWVRNDVELRELELWASSQSIRVGGERYRPHTTRIDLTSESPATLSFANRTAVQGRVIDRTDGRWTHYLAAPVVLREEPYSEIPVAVVVASLHAPDCSASMTIPGVVQNLSAIVAHMTAVGREAL